MNTTLADQKAAALKRLESRAAFTAKATMRENQARAEFCRLLLLEVAQEFPAVKGFRWEITWEYDDEGYYKSTSIYVLGDEEELASCDVDWFDEMLEIENSLDEGAMVWLGPENKEVTIEELKSMTI